MHVIWTVSPVGYQRITKRCPACNMKRDFIPAGAFRMNSQKKMLDVWCIYKCIHCEYTWNISLFSRRSVNRLDRELYGRIIANDQATIQHFAHDRQVLKRNNAELSGVPDFLVTERWPVTLIYGRKIKVSIRLTCSFRVSLLAILKKQLGLSTGGISRLITTGDISGITLRELKSRRHNVVNYDVWICIDTFYAARKMMVPPGVKQ